MLQSVHSQLSRLAGVQRPGTDLAAWNASGSICKQVNYFYGYWFSHWRA